MIERLSFVSPHVTMQIFSLRFAFFWYADAVDEYPVFTQRVGTYVRSKSWNKRKELTKLRKENYISSPSALTVVEQTAEEVSD